MFELLIIILFVWLFIHSVVLAFKLTWGVAKLCAGILIALALPILVLCLLFASGILLLVPIAMVGIAVGILKACLNP